MTQFTAIAAAEADVSVEAAPVHHNAPADFAPGADLPLIFTAAESPFPLQYYAVFRRGPDRAMPYPRFAGGLVAMPYVVLRRSA
jgi:hypothetical protein